MKHDTKATQGPAALAAAGLVVLSLLSSGCAASRGGDRAEEGTVVIARGAPVLVRTAKGSDFVALEPAATLVGIIDLRELRPGDRVRYEWRREQAGVKIAHRITADPYVRVDAVYRIGKEELIQALNSETPPLLLDARPAERHAAGHIHRGLSLPHDAPESALAAVLPADRRVPIVVYGEGPRHEDGNLLARRLVARGHADVKVLEGGVQRWAEADLRLDIAPKDFAALLDRGEPWVIVDVRGEQAFAAATVPGALPMTMEGFRWQMFDGNLPVRPILFLGGDRDLRSIGMAERIRALRSQTMNKSDLRLAVLEGGMEAWERAGLPVERGAPLRTEIAFKAVVEGEIDPAEFVRLWQARGGPSHAVLDVQRANPTTEAWVHRIPLEELAARIGELPKDREIVVYCTIGERSRVAAELLRAQGYRARFLRARPPA